MIDSFNIFGKSKGKKQKDPFANMFPKSKPMGPLIPKFKKQRSIIPSMKMPQSSFLKRTSGMKRRFTDHDRDGVISGLDCFPFDRKRHESTRIYRGVSKAEADKIREQKKLVLEKKFILDGSEGLHFTQNIEQAKRFADDDGAVVTAVTETQKPDLAGNIWKDKNIERHDDHIVIRRDVSGPRVVDIRNKEKLEKHNKYNFDNLSTKEKKIFDKEYKEQAEKGMRDTFSDDEDEE